MQVKINSMQELLQKVKEIGSINYAVHAGNGLRLEKFIRHIGVDPATGKSCSLITVYDTTTGVTETYTADASINSSKLAEIIKDGRLYEVVLPGQGVL